MNEPYLSQVSVWLVRERVSNSASVPPDPLLTTEQDVFVLAANLAEAIEIVGGTHAREIVAVQQVCPITYLPDSKWRIVPLERPQSEVAGTEGAAANPETFKTP